MFQMASNKFIAIIGILLVTVSVVIQSAPTELPNQPVQSSSIDNNKIVDQLLLESVDSEKSSTTTTTTPSSLSPPEVPSEEKQKKKRYIDNDLLDGLYDSDSDEDNNNVLHTNIKETSATIHDNADKPVDTDDSEVFSESQMTPNQLSNVLRQRRNVKLNEQSNQRRKRALTPYDLYEANSFYDPYADLIEQQEYDRPSRSFAPIYWYPSFYRRSLRSVLTPSFYEPSELPSLYSSTVDDDDNSDLIYDGDEDYESNRYPILLESPNNPFDNFELQQQYNIDDIPFDESFDDNDEEDFEGYNADDDDDDEGEYRSFYPRERLSDVWIV